MKSLNFYYIFRLLETFLQNVEDNSNKIRNKIFLYTTEFLKLRGAIIYRKSVLAKN